MRLLTPQFESTNEPNVLQLRRTLIF